MKLPTKEVPVKDDILELATRLKELKDQKEVLEAKKKEINAELDNLQPVFVDLLKERGIDKVSYDGIGTLFPQTSLYPRIIDEIALKKCLKKRGAASLMKLTVNHNTLKGYCNECVKNQTPIPDGVETYYKTEVRIRKAG